ncbi:MAG TPA: hypothetical protein VGJ16_03200, partial [Pirellulales bacterium]
MHDEFPNDPAKEAPDLDRGVSRRSVLKLMAASAALSGLTACTKLPPEKIVPYVRAPEEIIPGKPLFYATSMPHRGMGVGLLVESHMGRPTKVEGNPEHPASLGASDIFAQASVLSLYDPDRSQVVLREGRISEWPSFVSMVSKLRGELKSIRGAGLRILTGATSSPTFADQMHRLLQQFPEAKWYAHEPCGAYASLEGARLAFGKYLNTVHRFDQAAVVVSLDADFLSSGPAHVRHSRDFSNRRDPDGGSSSMNRLYVVESTYTNTGAMADHRLPARCGEIENVARALAAAVGLPVSLQQGGSPVPAEWLSALVRDLQRNRGASLVIAGESQPAYVHALMHAINQSLGNVGKTIVYTDPIELSPAVDSLPDLAKEIDAGQVSALVMLGTNPASTAPVDLDFAKKMLKVPLRIHLGLYA